MRTGAVLFDLAQLAVTRDGEPFEATDFNFWGVTFAHDGRHFYATLATGGKTYLIRGDIATRRATVIASNVECPSLSPDDTKIAFKQRVPGPGVTWRLSVLDLATMTVHHLAETRSVDDQVGVARRLDRPLRRPGRPGHRRAQPAEPDHAEPRQRRAAGDQHLERARRRPRLTPAVQYGDVVRGRHR